MTLDADLQRAITGMEEHAVEKGKTKRDRNDGSLLVQMNEESHALFYPKRVKTMTNAEKFAPEICVETIAMLHQWHQCRFCCQCDSNTMGEDELGGTPGWQARRISTLKPGEVSEMGGTHDDIKNLTTDFGDHVYNYASPPCATDVPPHICTGHKSGKHRRAGIDSPNYFTFPHKGSLYKHRTKDDDGYFAPYVANDEELKEMKMEDHYIEGWKRHHVVQDWDASTCEAAYLVRGNGTGSVMSRLPLVLKTPRPGYQFRQLYVECEMPMADPSIEKIYHQQGGLLPHETCTYVILSPEEYKSLQQFHTLWKRVDSSYPGSQLDNFSFEITEDDVFAVDMPEICFLNFWTQIPQASRIATTNKLTLEAIKAACIKRRRIWMAVVKWATIEPGRIAVPMGPFSCGQVDSKDPNWQPMLDPNPRRVCNDPDKFMGRQMTKGQKYANSERYIREPKDYMAGAEWYSSHDQIPKEELQFLKRIQMEVLMPPVLVMTPEALKDTVIGQVATRAGEMIRIDVFKPDGSPVDNLPAFLKTFKLQVRFTDPVNIHDEAHSLENEDRWDDNATVWDRTWTAPYRVLRETVENSPQGTMAHNGVAFECSRRGIPPPHRNANEHFYLVDTGLLSMWNADRQGFGDTTDKRGLGYRGRAKQRSRQDHNTVVRLRDKQIKRRGQGVVKRRYWGTVNGYRRFACKNIAGAIQLQKDEIARLRRSEPYLDYWKDKSGFTNNKRKTTWVDKFQQAKRHLRFLEQQELVDNLPRLLDNDDTDCIGRLQTDAQGTIELTEAQLHFMSTSQDNGDGSMIPDATLTNNWQGGKYSTGEPINFQPLCRTGTTGWNKGASWVWYTEGKYLNVPLKIRIAPCVSPRFPCDFMDAESKSLGDRMLEVRSLNRYDGAPKETYATWAGEGLLLYFMTRRASESSEFNSEWLFSKRYPLRRMPMAALYDWDDMPTDTDLRLLSLNKLYVNPFLERFGHPTDGVGEYRFMWIPVDFHCLWAELAHGDRLPNARDVTLNERPWYRDLSMDAGNAVYGYILEEGDAWTGNYYTREQLGKQQLVTFDAKVWIQMMRVVAVPLQCIGLHPRDTRTRLRFADSDDIHHMGFIVNYHSLDDVTKLNAEIPTFDNSGGQFDSRKEYYPDSLMATLQQSFLFDARKVDFGRDNDAAKDYMATLITEGKSVLDYRLRMGLEHFLESLPVDKDNDVEISTDPPPDLTKLVWPRCRTQKEWSEKSKEMTMLGVQSR